MVIKQPKWMLLNSHIYFVVRWFPFGQCITFSRFSISLKACSGQITAGRGWFTMKIAKKVYSNPYSFTCQADHRPSAPTIYMVGFRRFELSSIYLSVYQGQDHFNAGFSLYRILMYFFPYSAIHQYNTILQIIY